MRFLQIINVIIKHILVYHNSGEMSIFPKRIFYFKKRQNPQAVYGKIPKKHAIAFTPSRFQDFTFFALSGIRQSCVFCPMGEVAGEDKPVKVVDFTVAVDIGGGFDYALFKSLGPFREPARKQQTVVVVYNTVAAHVAENITCT